MSMFTMRVVVCDDRIEKYFKDCTCNNMIAMTICSLGRMSSIRNGGGESKAAQACVVIFRVYKNALNKVYRFILETIIRCNLQESTVTGYSDLRILCKRIYLFRLIFPSKHNLDLMVLLNALDFMLHKLRTFMKTDPAIKTDNCLT